MGDGVRPVPPGWHAMAGLGVLMAAVPIPADGKVEFAPGGKHVMLFNMRTLKPGQTLRLDFTFASGEQIYIDAPAYPAGSGGGDHKSGH